MVDAGNDLIACRQERAHACIQGRAHSVHTWHARIQVVSNNDALELVVRDWKSQSKQGELHASYTSKSPHPFKRGIVANNVDTNSVTVYLVTRLKFRKPFWFNYEITFQQPQQFESTTAKTKQQ